ncbi:sensor histidine kinase [Nitrosococcus wardiae]|uniref:histidine kinase n=1 Tax=Nitrosococcus wardiae TaxID=1814290 RepID=A0A4P7C096_9GAMM|nr:PAS domain S-box protein [Nitrosococcus wardiae]QBQ55841.1 PAS domain S-box protein [Nitrosococcus wardiae]
MGNKHPNLQPSIPFSGLFKAALEACADRIYIYDGEGRYLYANPSGLEELGLSLEAVIGRSWRELGLPTGIMERFENDLQTVITSGNPQISLIIYSRDGGSRYYEYLLSPVKNTANTVQMVVATGRDITPLIEAEKQAQENQQRFRNLCEAAPDGIVLVNPEGAISLVNTQTEKIFGYPREALLGQPLEKLIPERYRRLQKHYRTTYRQSPSTREMGIGRELYGLRADGTEFPVEVALSPFVSQGGTQTIAIIRDITVRKRAEEKIRGLNRSLQHKLQELARANQELEAFSYSVSHDLRAPLRAMRGFSRVLWEDYGEVLDEDGKHYLSRIQGASQRMGLLLDGLLQLSRINRHELDRSKLNLSVLAAEIVNELRQEQPEREVNIDIQPNMIAAADSGLLRICLENLLSNAWKYTREQKYPHVKFTCLEKEGEQIFTISDNGAGFNPNYQSKLFHVFRRLHNEHEFEGLGIGLATVQRVVHRHGGTIWAEGEEGQGASFCFTLSPLNLKEKRR